MNNLKKNIIVCALVAIGLAFLAVHPVHSQSILYGKLTGTITDDTGESLPGVTVAITSDAIITGKRSTVTSAKGSYVFLNLPVGKYTITASLEGFRTVIQENIAISAGAVITVDLMMTTGRIEESVTVTAAAPVIDSKSSTIATTIESDLLDKLPTSRDAFYDLSLTAPGMVSQGKDGSWLPSPSAYGGASNENIFLINGVNTTNPSMSSYGSLVSVNYDSVEEVRVLALGTKAEYGNFSGVAVDVLTKSGSNKFHGNVAFYSILGAAADNQPEPDVPGGEVDLGAFGPSQFGERLIIGAGDDIRNIHKTDWEGNFTLGGPIVKDKVWFYIGFDYVRSELDTPFWPLLESWKGRFGDIKISGEPWLNHRAWVAYHYENNDWHNGTWDARWDPTMTYGVGSEAHSASAQWQWLASGKTILTAKYFGFWEKDEPYLPDDAPDHPGYINWWKVGPHGVNGAFPYIEGANSRRQTVQADVSHYAEDFLGEHDLKFGVQYTRGQSNSLGGYFHGYANFAYPYRWSYNFYYYSAWYGDTGWLWYNRAYHVNPTLTVRKSDQLGFFIDDQWAPTKRLTLNLGLRFDKMTAKYGEGKVYEQPSTPNAINDPPPVIRDREGSGNIFDFKNLAPRIGITYALTKDMKTILRASYGRYFLPISLEYLRRFGPDMPVTNIHFTLYELPIVDLNGNGLPDPEDAVAAARLIHDSTPIDDYWYEDDTSWMLNVADGLKNQYTDQFTFNIERELFSNFSASITYLYKNTSDIFVQWPINYDTGEPWEYAMVPYTTQYGQNVELYDIVLKDYTGDGVVDGDDIVYIRSLHDEDFEVRNMPEINGIKPHRTYHGLQFVLKKRYSDRWQMLASFLYSTSDGIGRRTMRQDFNIEGPMSMDESWFAGLNQTINNLEGPLPFTQKYEFKLSGSYKIPFVEVDFGFRFRFNSGRPVWPVENVPQYAEWNYPDRPPNSVITSGGNFIVSIDPKDPWYLPSEKILDLRLDRAFRLADYGNIHLSLDILNVFNENAVTNAGYGGEMEPVIGLVSGLTFPSRKLRLSVRFQF